MALRRMELFTPFPVLRNGFNRRQIGPVAWLVGTKCTCVICMWTLTGLLDQLYFMTIFTAYILLESRVPVLTILFVLAKPCSLRDSLTNA